MNLVLRLKPSAVSATGQKSYTVSVRDMKISGKARDEYNKGLESLEKRDWQASLGHFTKAVKAFPEYYEAYYHMGLVEANLGQLDDAFGAFQKSLDVSRGRYARADFGVGYVLYLRGQLNEAEGVLRRGLEVDDHGPEGHVMLGMALLRLNRADEAEKCAQEALLRNPNFAQAYLVLADALARRLRFQEQLQSLETYLRLEPNGPLSPHTRDVRDAVAKIVASSQPQQ